MDAIRGASCAQSLPVLLVDLARVCGFQVKGAEEAAAVGGKIRGALHEAFGERSEELFEMKSAVHADTSSLAEVGAHTISSMIIFFYIFHLNYIISYTLVKQDIRTCGVFILELYRTRS